MIHVQDSVTDAETPGVNRVVDEIECQHWLWPLYAVDGIDVPHWFIEQKGEDA